ncbi:RNA-binding domain-containing protein [Auricularia subglabra TFB-10046 SS5]|nr:RNA-binding domain-containing protein [Auricularia subglabra TFB-10046 SS5]
MASITNPTPTLYVHNLNDKVKTSELRSQLYALFSTYGRVIDVVASKSPKMRGQAFLVFADLAAATTAMRACAGMSFYDKPLRIEYSRTKSYATVRQEDPNFVSPSLAKAKKAPAPATKLNGGEKRPRDSDEADAQREAKRGKADDGDEDEMEIEEDEDVPAKQPATNGVAAAGAAASMQRPPSATLLCTNLPQEITEDMLSVLFSQYQGFQSASVTASQHPAIVNGAQISAKTKMAQIFYDSAELASTAKEALDGFAVKKGWQMLISYV